MVSTVLNQPAVAGQASSAEEVAAVLAAATEDLIVATDPAGVVTVFNAGAERMLGYRAAEVVGRLKPLAWHDPAEVTRRAAELAIAPGFEVFVHAARHGYPETREWTLVRKDRTQLFAQLTVTPVKDARGEIGGTWESRTTSRGAFRRRKRCDMLKRVIGHWWSNFRPSPTSRR